MLMNFELLYLCLEPMKHLRLIFVPCVPGYQLTCAASHQFPRGLGPTKRARENSVRQWEHEGNVARPRTTSPALCHVGSDNSFIGPCPPRRSPVFCSRTHTADFQCVCRSRTALYHEILFSVLMSLSFEPSQTGLVPRTETACDVDAMSQDFVRTCPFYPRCDTS